MMLVSPGMQPATRSSLLLQPTAYVANPIALGAEVRTDTGEETLKGKVTYSKTPNPPIG